MKKVLVAAALSAGFACVVYAQQSITVELADTETALLGTATLTQGPKDVTIALDLKGLSLETVKMFADDAIGAGFKL